MFGFLCKVFLVTLAFWVSSWLEITMKKSTFSCSAVCLYGLQISHPSSSTLTDPYMLQPSTWPTAATATGRQPGIFTCFYLTLFHLNPPPPSLFLTQSLQQQQILKLLQGSTGQKQVI